MRRTLGYQLYACGKNGLPPRIVWSARTYRLRHIFKHDFFAATGLYHADNKASSGEAPTKIVLKLSRQQHFLGLPLTWLGTIFADHEFVVMRRLSDLPGVPRVLGRYGKTGVIYQYIEGRSLKELKDLPDDFFDQLLELLGRIHARNVVYLDMNKRCNILLGADGHPHLIDFQISLYINGHVPFCEPVSDYLRRTLQQADVYHLFKHKRRLSPHLLTDEERVLSLNRNLPMQAHRILAHPLRKLRRFALKALHDNGILPGKEHRTGPHHEDPTRSV
jgi:hypothetical protein